MRVLWAVLVAAWPAVAAPQLKTPDRWLQENPRVGSVAEFRATGVTVIVTGVDRGEDAFLVTNPRTGACRWFGRAKFRETFRVLSLEE